MQNFSLEVGLWQFYTGSGRKGSDLDPGKDQADIDAISLVR